MGDLMDNWKDKLKANTGADKMEQSKTYKNIQQRDQSPVYRTVKSPPKGEKLKGVI